MIILQQFRLPTTLSCHQTVIYEQLPLQKIGCNLEKIQYIKNNFNVFCDWTVIVNKILFECLQLNFLFCPTCIGGLAKHKRSNKRKKKSYINNGVSKNE